MANVRMPSEAFVAQLEAALRRGDGYIMGSKGQNPRKWSKDSWWFSQYTTQKQRAKALYWRANAERVWDCNGLAEGIYEEFSGVNVNTKARYNYAQWCEIKGKGVIPAARRVPGAAVFLHSSKSGYITHVGFLDCPMDASQPEGDWYVIEARGVLYGVVRTKLLGRGWNRWGWMTKYFDYGTETKRDEDALKNGDDGDGVCAMQEGLIRLGYDCGRYGADGDFGDATEVALRSFQRENALTEDGLFGVETRAAMERAFAALDAVIKAPSTVEICGGQCWIRAEPNVSARRLRVAREGERLAYAGKTTQEGWHQVRFVQAEGWVSGKYGRLTE